MSTAQETPVETTKNDEIPPITYRDVKNLQVQDHRSKRCADKKIPRFFISDIFNASSGQTKRFTVKGVDFKSVMIIGKVVSTYLHTEEKFVITVDDGTGEIDCFLQNDDRLEELKDTVDEKRVLVETQYKCGGCSDVLLQASLMMLNGAKHALNKAPHFKNFSIGDTVQLIGNLSDYKEKRYLFVNSIIRHEENIADITANYMNSLYYLYENVYNSSKYEFSV